MKFKFWKLPVFLDQKGGTCVSEFKDLPFKPRRIYFIFDVKQTRGGHAHKKEQEVFVCVKGSFKAHIHDGQTKRSFVLNKAGQALYTANMVWHEFDHFSADAVMLAISSTAYDGQKGYIMDLDQFKELCRKKSS